MAILFWIATISYLSSGYNLKDYAKFQNCFGMKPVPETCNQFDEDADEVVDLSDFLVFHNFFCGANPAECPECGDDLREGMEVCDGTDVGDETCLTQGYSGGQLSCKSDCGSFDVSECHECTNCADCSLDDNVSLACMDGICGPCVSNSDCCAPIECFFGFCVSP